MTVSTLNNAVVYRGNGATTAFAVPFKVTDEEQLLVRRRVYSTGVIDYTYTGTDYVYTGIGDSSGTLTLDGSALASTYELLIERIVPYTQDLDIVNSGGFYPDSVETQLDLIVMAMQQLVEKVNRSIKLSLGETATDLLAAAGRANKFVVFDEDGNPSLSSGTGSDAGLRSDLSSSTGGSLVRISGETVSQIFSQHLGRIVQAEGDINDLEAEIAASLVGLLPYETLVSLAADVSQADGTLAYVWGDATASNNTVYQWNGAAWEVAEWYFDGVISVVSSYLEPLKFGSEVETEIAMSPANGATAYLVGDKVAGMIIPSGSTGQNAFFLADFDLMPRQQAGDTLILSFDIVLSSPWTRDYIYSLGARRSGGDLAVSATTITNSINGNHLKIVLSYEVDVADESLYFFVQLADVSAAATDEFAYLNEMRLRAENTSDPLGSDADVNLDAALTSATRKAIHPFLIGGAQRSLTVRPDPGAYEYAWISDALDAITDASIDEPWEIRIAPKTGGYSEPEIATKDDVHLVGVGGEKAWIKFYQPADASLVDVTAHSAILLSSRTTLRNLRITCQNGRYGIHPDAPSMVDKLQIIEFCEVEHLGNQEVIDYVVGNGGSAGDVWASLCAVGMGTWDNLRFIARGSTFTSPDAPFVFHTGASGQSRGCFVDLFSNRFIATTPGARAFQAQALASNQLCLVNMVGNEFDGKAWNLVSGAAAEIAFMGHGNIGLEWEPASGAIVAPVSNIIG